MDKEDFEGFKKNEYVPIMRDRSILLLAELCKQYQPNKILEIGTYIGYSASVMLSETNATLITIEKDVDNAKLAQKNLEQFAKRAKVINDDAFNQIIKYADTNEKFDFIFLDGPKGQYIKYLPYLKKIMNINGVLVADNIYFHNMVKMEGKVPHKHRTIITNLRKFIDEITHDTSMQTTLYDFDDGVSVSIKLK